MNKKYLYIIIAAAIALLAAIAWYTVQPKNDQSSPTSATPGSAADGSQSATYQQYAAMTGETYDRNFIANMIAHHHGAIDMAKLALQNARHQELKDMAANIITAQQKEIDDMTAWQKQWGYPSTSADNMIDHSAMGTMDGMATMTATLEGKTGDEFDKLFIEQMIAHHQSAIDMASPGEQNASRQQLKDLTKSIISEQTKEINQLKQWQQAWGY